MIWLDRRDVEGFHAGLVADYGGLGGLRDQGALESALARPRNRAAYGSASLCELAAAYAYGICRNHPFVDGNKRTSFIAAVAFLELNGVEFTATEADVVVTTLALAASRIREQELAAWLESNSRPRGGRGRRK